MDSIPIPPSAIGRVGMVAQLQYVTPEHVGKIVAVRLPLRPMSSLAEHLRPVFAWHVLVLGAPVELNGRPCREIVVADRCLKPISQLEPEAVDALARSQAGQAAEEALADLRRILDAHPLSPEELDAFVEKAAEQFVIERLLQVVPPAVVLKELDFRAMGCHEDGCWQWSGMHAGGELHVIAGPDMFGRWTFTGRNVSARHAMLAERVVASEEPRGKVAMLVLNLWREAFGRDAPVPDNLQPALTYELHMKKMHSLRMGLPTLWADGEVLRATRRWISQRHCAAPDDMGPMPDLPMLLSFYDGLLRMKVGDQVYGCPAQGVWVGDCEVSMRELLALPFWQLRGNQVALERSSGALAINGQPLLVKERVAEVQF